MDEETGYAYRHRALGGCHWGRNSWQGNERGWSADPRSGAWAPPGTSGPHATPSSERPDVRISDADRNAVVRDLSDHFEAGRLNVTEFQERSERATNARTWRDLDGIFDDLPPLATSTEGSRRMWGPRPWMFIAIALVLVGGFTAANIVGSSGHGFWFPWFIIPIAIFLVVRRFWRRRWFASPTSWDAYPPR